jgi:hypothetical protein
MTPSQGLTQQAPTNIDQFQNSMINVVYNFCSIFTTPVEMALRPNYGTRYFSPVILFLTSVMMMLLPLFSAMADGFSHMLPFARFAGAAGIFAIGSLSKLYFFGSFIHGIRTWWRMLHMEREENSTYEGPPLPIFRIFPCSFWVTRIIIEPVFLFLISVVLQNFFVLQSSAAHYLAFAAIMLAMKQYVAWYRQWEFLRNLMDMRNAGPLIAKIVDNQASDDDLATIHLASTKNLPEDLRRDFTSHIARVFSGGENERAGP